MGYRKDQLALTRTFYTPRPLLGLTSNCCCSILVDAAGVEPAVPEAADLQSTGVTNFPTHPKSYSNNIDWILTNISRTRRQGFLTFRRQQCYHIKTHPWVVLGQTLQPLYSRICFDMVHLEGIEPCVSALKGQRPNR